MGHGYFKAYPQELAIQKTFGTVVGQFRRQNTLLSCEWSEQERWTLKQEVEEKDLTLPVLLYTKKSMAAMLRFLDSVMLSTRK